MSDQNLMDDPLVSFDAPVMTENKSKFFDDPFGVQENGHDLFPVEKPENQKVASEETASLNVQAATNGSATDNDHLLFDLDPNAPSTESKQENLLDAEEPAVDFTSFTNPAYQEKVSSPSADPVEQVAEELVTKVDLNASSPAVPAAPPADEPPKKPTSAGATKPTAATKPKPASTKPTSASTSTAKSTEAKPNLASRKTIHSAPVRPKPAAASTSPTQDTAKPTPRDIPTKPKPVTTASAAPVRPSVKTTIKPTRPSVAPKPTVAATSMSPDQQTTVLSTAPEPTSPSASATLPTTSKTRPTATKPVSRPTLSTRASTTTSTTAKSTTTTTAAKPRPTSQTRASVRPATATGASTTTLPKRSNSAHRPATADPTARAARNSGTEVSASGTTASNSKPNLGSVSSKVGSLQNTTHKAGGGAVKITTQKLQWNAKSKIGSLDNAHHKPGGGAVKIETKKLDFKEKAKAKTNSGIHDAATPNGDANTSATASNEEGATTTNQEETLESPTTN